MCETLIYFSLKTFKKGGKWQRIKNSSVHILWILESTNFEPILENVLINCYSVSWVQLVRITHFSGCKCAQVLLSYLKLTKLFRGRDGALLNTTLPILINNDAIFVTTFSLERTNEWKYSIIIKKNVNQVFDIDIILLLYLQHSCLFLIFLFLIFFYYFLSFNIRPYKYIIR